MQTSEKCVEKKKERKKERKNKRRQINCSDKTTICANVTIVISVWYIGAYKILRLETAAKTTVEALVISWSL